MGLIKKEDAMVQSLVLDTNIFYSIGTGRLRVSDILDAPSETIRYSPLTTLEIAGKWSTRTFSDRKSAARAILDTAARELPDTDIFLTKDIFGYIPDREPLSLSEAVKAMADASTMLELISGVPDYKKKVIRKVSVTKAAAHRQVTEGKWVRDLLDLQQAFIPKFSAWYDPDPRKRKGSVPKLSGKAKASFLANTTSHDWQATLVVACQSRALLGADRSKLVQPNSETVQKLLPAIQAIGCYCSVYTHYLIRLITGGALPDPNDSTDIELFLYSMNPDTIIVTSEKKWRSLADNAGFRDRVRTV